MNFGRFSGIGSGCSLRCSLGIMIACLAMLQYGYGAFLMKWMIHGMGFVLLLLSRVVVAAEIIPNATAGQEKSQVCVACHTADGNSVVPAWPKIAGQPEKYLIQQLVEYRKGDKGTRNNPVMFGITQSLSDQDIADLAAYFANQKPTVGATPEKWVALGEKIYRGGNIKTGVPACGPACHGPSGRGNSPGGFPPLSGQHADYIIDQLKAFKSGARSNDPNAIMRDISQRMTDEEMEAVGHYVSGLH